MLGLGAALSWGLADYFVAVATRTVSALRVALGWLSSLAFCRALAIGPISLLSPIVSGYAAVTVVLALVILGEHASVLETLAVIVTIGGVVVVSADVSP